MKREVKKLLDPLIEEFDVYVDDCFIEKVEGYNVLNIVLDSKEIIDLDKVTLVSRVINEVIDTSNVIKEDYDELDIYAKSKGEVYEK